MCTRIRICTNTGWCGDVPFPVLSVSMYKCSWGHTKDLQVDTLRKQLCTVIGDLLVRPLGNVATTILY